MRVALIVDRLRRRGGGLERYLRELAAFLTGRGDAVSLLSLGGDFSGAAWGSSRIAIPVLPRGARELAFAAAVDRVLRDGGFDTSLAVRHVLRAHVYEPHGGTVGAALAAREEIAGRPALSRIAHRFGPRGIAFRRLERSALRRSRLVVAVSERVGADLEGAGAPASRHRVLPLGVDLDRFAPSGKTEPLRVRTGAGREEAVLLFVGGEFDLKGLARAVEALPSLTREGRPARLVVLGSGRRSERRRVEDLARARGVSERVRFVGAVEDPAPWYRGADLLLHPTRYDACSLAVLESLACGTPVVTTPANGAVSGRSEGFRIVDRPDDAAAVARAAADLLAGGEHARAAARAAVGERDAANRNERLRELLSAAAGPLDERPAALAPHAGA